MLNDEINKKRRIRYSKNKEKLLEQNKKSYDKNKEKRLKTNQERYQQNKEKYKHIYEEYRKSIKGRYINLKKNANQRNIKFNLSLIEFTNITNKPCYYCSSNEKISIDRFDSTKCYDVFNAVPCCKKCNTAKWDLTFDEFSKHIEKIYNCLENKGFYRENNMKIGNQMMGALMMALQKSLMEQSDIVPVLKEMEIEVDKDGMLFVKNSPTLDLSKSVGMDYGGLTVEEIIEEEKGEKV